LRRHLDFRFRGRLPGVQIQAWQLRQCMTAMTSFSRRLQSACMQH